MEHQLMKSPAKMILSTLIFFDRRVKERERERQSLVLFDK
jgi:hypothetical protein